MDLPMYSIQEKNLLEIAAKLESEYTGKKDVWGTSPFRWIRLESSKRKGAIGEKLVERWLVSNGLDVSRSPDSDADRIINGHRSEIKMSTLWETGVYKFQQLRNQNYEFAICLGLSPNDIHCWVLPKQNIMEFWGSGVIGSQHNGNRGHETAWFSVDPDNVPNWLSPFGGTLESSINKIISLTTGK
jgi:hypothetical protein